jgi:DNA-binding LacI/PurR family transcriptional regulator
MTSPEDNPLPIGIVLRRSQRDLDVEAYYQDIIAGLEDTLAPSGHDVLLQIVDSIEAELECYRRWSALPHVCGVVLSDLETNDLRPSLLLTLGLPSVNLGEPVVIPHRAATGGIAAVCVDNEAAMRLAVGYLAGLGHTAVGWITGPPQYLHTQARRRAFLSETARLGLRGTEVEASYSTVSGTAATRTLLGSADPPTGIICDDDVMAVAALVEAQRLGVSVPEQLSILAWDDSTNCQLTDPPLSVMSHDIHGLGVAAATLLLGAMEGRTPPDTFAPLPTVIPRSTTGPSPAGSRS